MVKVTSFPMMVFIFLLVSVHGTNKLQKNHELQKMNLNTHSSWTGNIGDVGRHTISLQSELDTSDFTVFSLAETINDPSGHYHVFKNSSATYSETLYIPAYENEKHEVGKVLEDVKNTKLLSVIIPKFDQEEQHYFTVPDINENVNEKNELVFLSIIEKHQKAGLGISTKLSNAPTNRVLYLDVQVYSITGHVIHLPETQEPINYQYKRFLTMGILVREIQKIIPCTLYELMKYRDIYTAHANQVENNFSEIYKRSKNSLEKYIKNMNSAYPMAVQPKKLLYKVHDHEAFDEKKFTLNPKYTDNLYMPEMTKKSLQSLEDYLHKVVTTMENHPEKLHEEIKKFLLIIPEKFTLKSLGMTAYVSPVRYDIDQRPDYYSTITSQKMKEIIHKIQDLLLPFTDSPIEYDSDRFNIYLIGLNVFHKFYQNLSPTNQLLSDNIKDVHSNLWMNGRTYDADEKKEIKSLVSTVTAAGHILSDTFNTSVRILSVLENPTKNPAVLTYDLDVFTKIDSIIVDMMKPQETLRRELKNQAQWALGINLLYYVCFDDEKKVFIDQSQDPARIIENIHNVIYKNCKSQIINRSGLYETLVIPYINYNEHGINIELFKEQENTEAKTKFNEKRKRKSKYK